jgi:TatD DNase family protein
MFPVQKISKSRCEKERNGSVNTGGVVHSFTGSIEEAQDLLKLHPRIFIGINGCSLKTEDNLAAMASVPLQRLMIETDAPWCDLRRTHASAKYVVTTREAVDRKKHRRDALVKARNEPCNVDQVRRQPSISKIVLVVSKASWI